jgi:hypothetical protein
MSRRGYLGDMVLYGEPDQRASPLNWPQRESETLMPKSGPDSVVGYASTSPKVGVVSQNTSHVVGTDLNDSLSDSRFANSHIRLLHL